MEDALLSILQNRTALGDGFIHILRYIAPAVAVFLLIRCMKPLLTFRKEPEIWGWLNMPDGSQIPITHWENVIGRSKHCDITIDFPTVSRNHAVLTRYDDGSWTISDAGSKDGVMVNGKKVQICAVHTRSRISIGGVEMQLQPITEKQEARQAQLRTRAANGWDTVANLLLTILQILMVMLFFFGKRLIRQFGQRLSYTLDISRHQINRNKYTDYGRDISSDRIVSKYPHHKKRNQSDTIKQQRGKGFSIVGV